MNTGVRINDPGCPVKLFHNYCTSLEIFEKGSQRVGPEFFAALTSTVPVSEEFQIQEVDMTSKERK